MQLPLFPLKTVLLPGNSLPLRIFEPRYTDMIADCMRNNSAFGVVLIYQGEEVKSDIEIFTFGTTASIVDWQQLDDGLLGVTVEGRHRFEVETTQRLHNGLLVGEVNLLEEQPVQNIPDHFYYMLELLNHMTNRQAGESLQQDFSAMVYKLVYLLPLDNTLKQQILEVADCYERAMVLHAELIRLGVIQYIKPGVDYD
jgi:hypothetical protein